MAKIIRRIVIFFLLFVIVLLFFVYLLEKLDVLKSDIVFGTATRVINAFGRPRDSSPADTSTDVLLLEKLRLEKQQEELAEREASLEVREGQLSAKEAELQARAMQLEEQRKSLEEQQKSLNQLSKRFENRNEVLRYNVQSLVNMPPQNAVAILQGYDDQLLVDTLVVADAISEEDNTQSLVPYWLSLMEAERAAAIQKKLVYRN